MAKELMKMPGAGVQQQQPSSNEQKDAIAGQGVRVQLENGVLVIGRTMPTIMQACFEAFGPAWAREQQLHEAQRGNGMRGEGGTAQQGMATEGTETAPPGGDTPLEVSNTGRTPRKKRAGPSEATRKKLSIAMKKRQERIRRELAAADRMAAKKQAALGAGR